MVAHLEQLPFSSDSPSPFGKGSLSVNEEEEVAHWLFCRAEIVLYDFSSFSNLKVHNHAWALREPRLKLAGVNSLAGASLLILPVQ